MGGQQLTQSSWFGADGHSRFQVLWQDGDRVFCRRVDGERDVLAVLLAAEHPAPAALDRLAHEYSLKDELDGAWAVRPLELRRSACAGGGSPRGAGRKDGCASVGR